ncbi:hypothetical protein [Portibacter lacus]|uniref:hypothetical protein n=1 Tax=Portibacter lacus TaxID=1099794 RepID=UPI001F486CCF|nr:hypothetical protein [Portibacter lacus]
MLSLSRDDINIGITDLTWLEALSDRQITFDQNEVVLMLSLPAMTSMFLEQI